MPSSASYDVSIRAAVVVQPMVIIYHKVPQKSIHN
jgi:hypothetical protein